MTFPKVLLEHTKRCHTLMSPLFINCFAIKIIQIEKLYERNDFNRHFKLFFAIFYNLNI